MAYAGSRKNTVLQKYHTKLLHTLSECIEDILPDLESAGAISGDQRAKVREYVHGKMPANAVEYLLNDHIERPLSAAQLSNAAFMKVLQVMKAPKCSTQCKVLATAVEEELKNKISNEMDEVTKWMQSLGNTGLKVIEGRVRRWKAWVTNTTPDIAEKIGTGIGIIISLYDIHGYKTHDQTCPLIKPLFLAKGPSDELFVRDYGKHQLVVFSNDGDKLEYSRYMCGEGNGYGKFKDITGIAASKDHLYVADCQLDSIQKLKLQNGEWVKTIGSNGNGDGEFDTPFGIALDEANSRLYVCDYGNHRIQIFKDDKFSKSFGGSGTSEGKFNHPGDIALNNDKDQLFITDFDNHRVQVFKTNGSFIKVFGNDTEFCYPFGICYAFPVVLISSVHTNYVYMVKVDETSASTLPGSFNCPCGVVMMDDGQIVVANFLGNKLTVV